GALEGKIRPGPRAERRGRLADHERHAAARGVGENPAPGGLQGGRELLAVAGTSGRLLRERTNRADAAERLLGHDPGFRVRLLRAGRKGLHTAAEDPRGDGDRRYREHQDQSECGRGVEEERHPERDEQREAYGGAKWFTHGATDDGHDVQQAGRELTDVPVVEESYFLGQQLIEHALS